MLGVYVLAVFLFSLTIAVTRLPQSCSHVLKTTHLSAKVIADRGLDDMAKEYAIQQAALRMLKDGGLIAIKGAITVTATMLPLWVADAMTLVPWEDSIQFALRLDVLGITTLVMFASWLVWRRWLR